MTHPDRICRKVADVRTTTTTTTTRNLVLPPRETVAVRRRGKAAREFAAAAAAADGVILDESFRTCRTRHPRNRRNLNNHFVTACH